VDLEGNQQTEPFCGSVAETTVDGSTEVSLTPTVHTAGVMVVVEWHLMLSSSPSDPIPSVAGLGTTVL
jgi:hypothetical protein